MERELLTIKEAAGEIPCGVTLVYKMLGDGRLDGVRLDGKSLVTAASISRLQKTLPKLMTPTAVKRQTKAGPIEETA